MLVFGRYLTPNSKMVGAITPKIDENFPFVIWNLLIKLYLDQTTIIQVIANKPSV